MGSTSFFLIGNSIVNSLLYRQYPFSLVTSLFWQALLLKSTIILVLIIFCYWVILEHLSVLNLTELFQYRNFEIFNYWKYKYKEFRQQNWDWWILSVLTQNWWNSRKRISLHCTYPSKSLNGIWFSRQKTIFHSLNFVQIKPFIRQIGNEFPKQFIWSKSSFFTFGRMLCSVDSSSTVEIWENEMKLCIQMNGIGIFPT